MLKTHSFKDVFFISNKTIHKTNSINKNISIRHSNAILITNESVIKGG